MLVGALRRRIEAAGGTAVVLAKGDATAGALLLVLTDRGVVTALRERRLGADGYAWDDTGPADSADPAARGDYLARRRRGDSDLWIVELEHPDAARIVEETTG